MTVNWSFPGKPKNVLVSPLCVIDPFNTIFGVVSPAEVNDPRNVLPAALLKYVSSALMNRLPEPDSVIILLFDPSPDIVRFDAKVVTPDILTLSKFVWPSTSKSLAILTTPLIVEIPEPLPPPEIVIVLVAPDPDATTPDPTKLSVDACVDNAEPSSWTVTPPLPEIPVSAEPSPTNDVAVTTPETFYITNNI